ncbi:MAG: hypothetical protein V4692_12310 [Bdellovibrionota bacterium]
MRNRLLAATVIFASVSVSQAQVTFSEEEVATHKAQIGLIIDTASSCVQNTWDEHVAFYEKHGVSKFYGDRKEEYASPSKRRAALRMYGKSESLEPELVGISCVGLTTKCLGKGFTAAGQGETWKRIYAEMRVHGMDGTKLQAMLRNLGWKSIYWNPDTSKNAAWDIEDRKLNPLIPTKVWMGVWGDHANRYQTALKKGTYYGVPVDDVTTLVDFKTTVPESFKQAPFFVGTAHAGYHVFPGMFGEVIEAHSRRNLNAFDNLEISEFNPLGTKGGPRWTRSEKYRSGIIVVPPKPEEPITVLEADIDDRGNGESSSFVKVQ